MKKIKLLAFILIAAFALAMVGCGGHNGVPSGFDVKVTYCFNGGTMSGYSDRTELELYYKQGSLIAEPGASTAEFSAPSLAGYSIGGWYVAATDEAGELVRDEDGKPVVTSRKFDFKNDRAEKNIWLVASWVRKLRVTFINLYQTKMTTPYFKDYESGQTITQPPLKTSWVDGNNFAIEGYYFSYDEETGEYSEPVNFTGLIFEYLYARLPENPSMEGDYILFNIYVKLAQV